MYVWDMYIIYNCKLKVTKKQMVHASKKTFKILEQTILHTTHYIIKDHK